MEALEKVNSEMVFLTSQETLLAEIYQYWQYGQVFENRTGNGMTGALVARKVDFALAAMGSWFQLFKYFSFSISIQWIGITTLTPKPKLIPAWKIIFLMFSGPVWTLVIVTYIFYSTFLYLLPTEINRNSARNKKGITWNLLNVFAGFLLLPSVSRRSRASEVIVSITLHIFTLIVGYVYIGQTHSIRAFPVFQPPVDTVKDLALSHLRWNAPHEVWTYMISQSQDPYMKMILSAFHVAPIPALKTLADEGNEPLCMAALHNGNFMVGPWFTADNIENYRMMSEYLYFEYDTAYATKTWPLLSNFDELTGWMRDVCLFQYVELVDVFRYMDYRVQTSIKHSRDRQKMYTYFFGVYTMCRVIQRNINITSLPAIQTALPMTVVNFDDKSTNNTLIDAINLGSTVFVTDEESVLNFLNLFIPTHDESMFRNPVKYLIVSIGCTGSDQKQLLDDIQNHPGILEIANLLLVVTVDDSFELITHRWVGNPPECLDFLLLDKYFPENDSFLDEAHLFPNKFNDLMGKTMKVATFYLLPWAMMRKTDDGIVQYLNQTYTIDGLDGHILVQFCQWYNCTWDLSVDQYWQYGQVFENHTGNGMIGALVERKVDFAIGAVGGWFQLFKYFSFSTPIQWIGVTSLAPKPELIPSWTIIFLMFSKPVWFVLIATFILCSLLLYVIPKVMNPNDPTTQSKDLSWCFLSVLASLLLLPAPLRRNRPTDVIFVVALLSFCLLVASIYISKIHSILAFPIFQPPIDTIYDLAVSEIPWNAPHEAWMYALVGTENPYVKKILTTFRVAPIPDLHTKANVGSEALVMAELNYGHYMVGTWVTAQNVENYRLMTEFIYFEYDTGYATKTWPMLDRFDYLTMWIRDACLYQYVELNEVYNYMDYWVETSIAHSRDHPPNELKPFVVEDITGGLIILGIGYLIAVVVFVLEIIIPFGRQRLLEE